MENELITLLGGVTIEVTNRKGETSQVRVREMRIAEFEKLLPVLDEEEKTAALYCDQTPQWAANLTTESLERVIEEGEKLNFEGFQRWLTRRAARTQRVGRALKVNQKMEGGG